MPWQYIVWVLACYKDCSGHTSRKFRSICVRNILGIGPNTFRYVIRIVSGSNMMMPVIIAKDITSSKSVRFSISIPYFTNITIPNIENIKMILRIQIITAHKTTNQSSSPKVLLYGSRQTSLIVVVLKDAIETFVFKRNILLFDFILFRSWTLLISMDRYMMWQTWQQLIKGKTPQLEDYLQTRIY